MPTTARLLRPILILAVVSLFAACSGAAPGKSAPASARPSAATAATPEPVVDESSTDAWLAVGRPGEDRLQIILAGTMEEMVSLPLGAPDANWANVVTATPDEGMTHVQDLPADRAFRPESLGQKVAGAWRLPTVGLDPVPVGVSADGSTIVLVETEKANAKTSRFAILERSFEAQPRMVELVGEFEFDALSPDGSLLYVVEHLAAPPAGHYQVRTVETATGALRPDVIVDKLNVDETMAGWPVAQARRADGQVLTLYRGAEHPFIHALNSVDAWAICLDLPATGADNADAAVDWGLVPARDGRNVLAVNATLGLVVEVDPVDFAIKRSVSFEPSAARGIVLAKFGHQASGPAGRRVVASPDGTSVFAAGPGGIVRIDTSDFAVKARFVEGQAVEAMAVTPDGGTVYALLGAGGSIVKLDASTGQITGRVQSDGFDRLVAIVPY